MKESDENTAKRIQFHDNINQYYFLFEIENCVLFKK